jgi:hypothetical protein
MLFVPKSISKLSLPIQLVLSSPLPDTITSSFLFILLFVIDPKYTTKVT